jgi:hypothetical protein
MANPFLIKLNLNPSANDIIMAFNANSSIVRVINPSPDVIIESSLKSTILFTKYVEAKVPNLTEEVILAILKQQPYYIWAINKPTLAMQWAAIKEDINAVTHLRCQISDDDLAIYVVKTLEKTNDMDNLKWYIYKIPLKIKHAYELAQQFKTGAFLLVEKEYASAVQQFLGWTDEQIYPFIPL